MLPFTPLEALAMFEDDYSKTFKIGVYTLYMDGPMMCTRELLAPFVHDEEENYFFVSGQVGDPVTEKSFWVS